MQSDHLCIVLLFILARVFITKLDSELKESKNSISTMDVEKICRVCMSVGSRNIFKKTPAIQGATVSPNPVSTALPSENSDSSASVSSIEKLLEKLRYVTLIKVCKIVNHLLCAYLLYASLSRLR